MVGRCLWVLGGTMFLLASVSASSVTLGVVNRSDITAGAPGGNLTIRFRPSSSASSGHFDISNGGQIAFTASATPASDLWDASHTAGNGPDCWLTVKTTATAVQARDSQVVTQANLATITDPSGGFLDPSNDMDFISFLQNLFTTNANAQVVVLNFDYSSFSSYGLTSADEAKIECRAPKAMAGGGNNPSMTTQYVFTLATSADTTPATGSPGSGQAGSYKITLVSAADSLTSVLWGSATRETLFAGKSGGAFTFSFTPRTTIPDGGFILIWGGVEGRSSSSPLEMWDTTNGAPNPSCTLAGPVVKTFTAKAEEITSYPPPPSAPPPPPMSPPENSLKLTTSGFSVPLLILATITCTTQGMKDGGMNTLVGTTKFDMMTSADIVLVKEQTGYSVTSSEVSSASVTRENLYTSQNGGNLVLTFTPSTGASTSENFILIWQTAGVDLYDASKFTRSPVSPCTLYQAYPSHRVEIPVLGVEVIDPKAINPNSFAAVLTQTGINIPVDRWLLMVGFDASSNNIQASYAMTVTCTTQGMENGGMNPSTPTTNTLNMVAMGDLGQVAISYNIVADPTPTPLATGSSSLQLVAPPPPPPPPPVTAVVAQTTEFSGLTPENFAKGQTTYNKGYGRGIGIVNTNTNEFFDGNSVSSVARDARRALLRGIQQLLDSPLPRRFGTIGVVGTISVTFTAQVTAALAEVATVQATSLNTASLQQSINAVIAADPVAAAGVVVPNVTGTVSAPTVVTVPPEETVATPTQDQILQVVNILDVTRAQWILESAVYNKGYARAIGIWDPAAQVPNATAVGAYKDGCSVISVAQARGGRSGTLMVSFTATVVAALQQLVQANANALTTSALQAAFAATTPANTVVPTISYVVLPQYTSGSSSSSSLSTADVVGISVASCVVAAAIIAGLIYYLLVQRGQQVQEQKKLSVNMDKDWSEDMNEEAGGYKKVVTDKGTVSEGPPVVLFPSLAGSVLECQESTVEGFKGKRIWMALGSMMSGANAETATKVKDSATSYHMESNPFVQHMMLDPDSDGKDHNGIKVRAKEGLAGCEYLSEELFVKDGTVIMGIITDMLRKHGYQEWDPEAQWGSMIGAAFDWRIMPGQMEERDDFFTKIMKQTEAMVDADPQQRPAHVIGFSLGCKISKYFLHFCHAMRGRAWVDRYIQHFIPLGGPFLGSVQLLRAMQVDGAFPPLDAIFSTSQMLTIMRSVPVGRYLQPVGNWKDGLDLPFVFVRKETYVKVRIGKLELAEDFIEEDYALRIHVAGTRHRRPDEVIRGKPKESKRKYTCLQTFNFHRQYPFYESITVAVPDDTHEVTLRVELTPKKTLGTKCKKATNLASLYLLESNERQPLNGFLEIDMPTLDNACELETTVSMALGDEWSLTEEEKEPKKCVAQPVGDVQHHIVQELIDKGPGVVDADAIEESCCSCISGGLSEGKVARLTLRIEVTPSDALIRADEEEDETHPMMQHNGGRGAGHEPKFWNFWQKSSWGPAHALVIQKYEELREISGDSWKVPSPDGLIEEYGPPPVNKVTAIYGINQVTPRCVFVRHRDMHGTGGETPDLKPPIVLDPEGDVDGMLVIGGVGYETQALPQLRPDDGKEVLLSGDGTVNYQSLRHAATWKNACDVSIYELPGCDHRGASSDPRMLRALRKTLGLSNANPLSVEELDVQVERLANMKFDGGMDRVAADSDCFGIIGKLGVKKFRIYYKISTTSIALLALTAMIISILILWSGSSEDWDTTKQYSWGTGAINIFNPALEAELYNNKSILKRQLVPYEFNLGLLNMANRGGGGAPERSSWRMKEVATLQKYQNWQGCTTDDATTTEAEFHLENTLTDPTSNNTAVNSYCQMVPGLVKDSTPSYVQVSCNYQGSGGPAILVWSNAACNLGTPTVIRNLNYGCSSMGTLGSTSYIKVQCATYNSTMSYLATATNAWRVWGNNALTRVMVTSYPNGSSLSNNYGSFLQENGQGVLLPGSTQCHNFLCVGWGPGPEDGNASPNINSHTWQIEHSVHAGRSCSGPIVQTRVINSSLTDVPMTPNGTDQAKSNPFIFGMPNGAYVQVYCPVALYAPNTVKYTVAEQDCVIRFSECRERSENIYQSCTTDPNMVNHCDTCYNVGVFTFVVMIVTLCVQVPLVWLSFIRADPFKDSRCAKFWSVPISFVVTCLSITAEVYWLLGCSDPITGAWLDSVAIAALSGSPGVFDTYGEFIYSENTAAFLPVFSAACTLLICFLNMATPVPEFFQGMWIDPPEERYQNSLRAATKEEKDPIFPPMGDLVAATPMNLGRLCGFDARPKKQLDLDWEPETPVKPCVI